MTRTHQCGACGFLTDDADLLNRHVGLYHPQVRRIVQAHGCFDLLHLGHIRHLEAAKEAGDWLVVTITADRYISKGPGRPVFTAIERAEAVDSLRCVDQVMISEGPTAAAEIREIKPQVFAKGQDYTPETIDPEERAAMEEVGAELFITQTQKWSSTALLQQETKPPAVAAYLTQMRSQYAWADIQGWLEQMRGLMILVVGDSIRDVYCYCNTLGKSGKEPILAAQFLNEHSFSGGAHAVKQHAMAAGGMVSLKTGPTVTKRRFLESYPLQKLFEVYEMDELAAARSGDLSVRDIELAVRASDLVIVADYGHGFVTPALAKALMAEAKFLAVNVQANAGNHGFHTISKYPRADFISLSERELRLDARDQTTDIRKLADVAAYARHGRVLVTRGEKGCLAAERVATNSVTAEAPALTTHAVDRVGAGDAVFGVTACCAAVGMPLDLLTCFAAVAGTEAVGIIGNSRYLERETLEKRLAAIFL